MDITGPANPSSLLTLATPPTTTSWRVGQRLEAVVVSPLNQGRVSLRIGDALVEARTTLATFTGQRLTLEVMEAGKQLILRIIADISGSANSLAQLTLTKPPTGTPQWRVGQRLEAVVVSTMNQNKVSIRIGDAVLEAHTTSATSAGQRLSLEVMRTDDRHITFRILAGVSDSDTVTAALRTALPQQLPLQTVFKRFVALLTASSGLPPTVNSLLKKLLQQLPSAANMSRADTLKQALAESGLFLEHRLQTRAQPTELGRDLKANLLRLLAGVTTTGNQSEDSTNLARLTEAALARVQAQQLTTLTQEQPPTTWAGELPVRHGNQIDVLQYRIEKDGGQGTATQQPGWSTWLSLNLETLGPLHTKITLSGNTVSASFWAESGATAELLGDHIPRLQLALEHAGLEVRDIRCRHGRPPFPPPARFPKQLLDLSV